MCIQESLQNMSDSLITIETTKTRYYKLSCLSWVVHFNVYISIEIIIRNHLASFLVFHRLLVSAVAHFNAERVNGMFRSP